MAEIRHFGSCRLNAKTRFSGKKLSNLELRLHLLPTENRAKSRFSQKLSNLELWCLLTAYRKLCNWAFQRTHHWIPKLQDGHVENRHNVIFFCWGWSDLDKISQTGAEWHVDCGDVVEIETRCRIPIWRTFGRIQWHVILEPPDTLQGAATWRIQCHNSRATYHIAGCYWFVTKKNPHYKANECGKLLLSSDTSERRQTNRCR